MFFSIFTTLIESVKRTKYGLAEFNVIKIDSAKFVFFNGEEKRKNWAIYPPAFVPTKQLKIMKREERSGNMKTGQRYTRREDGPARFQ